MLKDYATSTRVGMPGLKRPVRVLHLTDIHICRVDVREEHAETALARQAHMDPKRAFCKRATELLGKIDKGDFDQVIVTGDLADFPSNAAVAFAQKVLNGCKAPLHFVGGNHDTQFPWTQNANALSRTTNLELWSPLAERRPRNFARWEVKGLQFLSVDDSNYQVDAEQLAFVREHLTSGQPTVLALHIPLTQPRLKQMTIRRWRDPILLGEPLPEDRRKIWGAEPTRPETARFLKLVERSRNLHAVLCGHVHFGHEELLGKGPVQLVGPPGYEGAFRIVEFVPQAR